MGTLINGIKEIFASASQTSPTNIPTCASDGTPNGNITIANLASVLGGLTYSPTDDFNTMTQWGIYSVLDAHIRSNYPSELGSGSAFLFVSGWQVGNDKRVYQVLFAQGGIARRDYVTSWTPWKIVSEGIPTFYKDYSTLSGLQSALSALLDVGYLSNKQITDANNVMTVSKPIFCCMTDSNIQNLPSGKSLGFLISFHCGGSSYQSFGVQIFVDFNSTDIFFRHHWNSWFLWQKFALV